MQVGSIILFLVNAKLPDGSDETLFSLEAAVKEHLMASKCTRN